MTDIALDLFLILSTGLVASLICRHLRVSSVLGYLAGGALLGDSVLGWVGGSQTHEIEHFAEIGVFFLLFSIGMEFSLEELAALGKPLFVGGSVQMTLVAAPLCLFLKSWGATWPNAILISCALGFSSTVLVFKALAEAGKVSSKLGRRGIAILLFQDAALVPILLLVPLLTRQGEEPSASDYFFLAGATVVFVGSIFVLRRILRHVLPLLAQYRSPEIVVLFAVSLLGGETLAAHHLGLPPSVGAFAAGLVMSDNRWTSQIDALVLPFRETFAAIFFVSLGLLFHLPGVVAAPLVTAVALVGLITLKAGAATLALRLTGLAWRVAWRMGVGLAHVGEFAFVLLLAGWQANLVSEMEYRWLVTLSFGSLLLTPIFLRFSLIFHDESEELERELFAVPRSIQTGLVIGTGPMGRRVASYLETRGRQLCLIDLSAVNLYPFAQQGFRTVAGDATDLTVLSAAGAEQTDLIVVCVPDDETAIRVVRQIRRRNQHAMVVVRCRYLANVKRLTRSGADHVVNEERYAAEQLVRLLETMERPTEQPVKTVNMKAEQLQ